MIEITGILRQRLNFVIPVPSPVLDDISILNGTAAHTGHAADAPVFRPHRHAVNHLDALLRAPGRTDTAADAAVISIELLNGHIPVTQRIHGPGKNPFGILRSQSLS